MTGTPPCDAPALPAAPVRLSWVQPEDLVGHELRQAAEDGRDAEPLLRAWLTAGGHPAPGRAGASTAPAPPELRALASRLLTELEGLPSPSARDEPTAWPDITATWTVTRTATWTAPPVAAGHRGGPGLRERLERAWVGRAVGCVLGKPVEKLPLEGIRALARAAGNWPLDDWFTEHGVPAELLAAHPWNRRSAATSLAENIDGAPEDDDLNYPLLNLILLRRYGRGFSTADVARLWLDELLPAGPSPPSASRTGTCCSGSSPRPPPPTTTPSANGSAPSSGPTSTAGPTPATRPPPRPRRTGTPPSPTPATACTPPSSPPPPSPRPPAAGPTSTPRSGPDWPSYRPAHGSPRPSGTPSTRPPGTPTPASTASWTTCTPGTGTTTGSTPSPTPP